MERWLPVPGYENYEVSDEGRARSLPHTVEKTSRWGGKVVHHIPGKLLKLHAGNGQGSHNSITLCRNGKAKRFLVHRLVLTAFVGPPPTGESEACHQNGDDKNNRLDNLRWDNRQGNMSDMARHGSKKGVRHHGAKLTDETVIAIRRAHAAGAGVSELARQHKVTHTTIGRVVHGRGWLHLTDVHVSAS
jgi:hypothetical protein